MFESYTFYTLVIQESIIKVSFKLYISEYLNLYFIQIVRGIKCGNFSFNHSPKNTCTATESQNISIFLCVNLGHKN